MVPLQFRPLLKQYIWGGRQLSSVLGKDLESLPGPNRPESAKTCAESWEICDHGDDQSVVDGGELAGTTLAQLVADHGRELLGRHHPQARFPLLLKFLDAAQSLSLQVHPDDERAKRLDPPDLGKTEAWVVIRAEPGSVIYAGLRPGIDRQTLAQAIESGNCQDCLHQFEPAPGDCVFIPAGTAHALGKGLLIAEIQQASDTTYRLFDWNRLGTDGKPRPLHVQQGVEAIDYAMGPVKPVVPVATERDGISRLVACDQFVLDAWHLGGSSSPGPQSLGGDDRFHILTVIEGTVRISGDATSTELQSGQTVLLPASLGPVEIAPQGPVFALDAYLP